MVFWVWELHTCIVHTVPQRSTAGWKHRHHMLRYQQLSAHTVSVVRVLHRHLALLFFKVPEREQLLKQALDQTEL